MSGMIVIVEGVDRVGKTTFCRKLEALGFQYFKDCLNVADDESWLKDPMKHLEYVSMGKLDTTLSMLTSLTEKGINVVVDRLHLTELAYGMNFRKTTAVDLVLKIDEALSKLNCMLVLLQPVNYAESSEQAGYDVAELDNLFKFLYGQSKIRGKVCTDYNDTSLIQTVIRCTFQHDLYFAAPFFKPSQVVREERLKESLRAQGFSVFSPKEMCILRPDACMSERTAVFNLNLQAMRDSLAVFAVTDEKDVGTIWEAGYAFGINKPVLYFAETLNGSPFNVMLAQSGRRTFVSHSEVLKYTLYEAIYGKQTDFRGSIE